MEKEQMPPVLHQNIEKFLELLAEDNVIKENEKEIPNSRIKLKRHRHNEKY